MTSSSSVDVQRHLRIDQNLLLWSIGLIQPAAASEIARLIETVTRSKLPADGIVGIAAQCEHCAELGLISVVNKRRGWYSLTYTGDTSIPKKLRRDRDRRRIFLLKGAWLSRIPMTGEFRSQKMIDGSSIEVPSEVPKQDVSRPTESCDRVKRGTQRFRWPRIFEQINTESGSATSSPVPNPNSLAFYSLPVKPRSSPGSPYPANAKELALAIGISARLLTLITKFPEKHYRQFTIPKANGSERSISSPKVFLKVIQYWLNDYILCRLPVHQSCYSFLPNTSIADNAVLHVGMRYVGSIDVENYFGSIRTAAVEWLLKKTGYTTSLARIVSRLATLNDALPQGAPSSPAISNAYLFSFDESLTQWCARHKCNYSRYADDISISGNDIEVVKAGLDRAKVLLGRFKLTVNHEKTRIQSRGGQQIVTGLVVNERAQPTREQRRRVRAMIHRYSKGLMTDQHEINQLRGWISYLRSFEHLKEKFQQLR